jgi:hypothetical protein
VNDPGGVRDAQGRRDLDGDLGCLTEREPRRRESLPEGLALDVLHRDVVLALARLPERVDCADVWVIEGGRGPSLLLEALNAIGIAREVGRQELQGHLPPKA